MSIIRIDKFIADSSSLSRKEATKSIKSGKIKINGETITDSSYKLNTQADLVIFCGVPIVYKENYYIMMNKPRGYLSATEDKYDKTVMELLSKELPRDKLFPAGRLDKDTEGFLFITNDGQLAHRITGPKNHIPKKYYVTLDKPVPETLIDIFRNGVTLENDEKCKSAELEIIGKKDCYLTLTEGKFHQVKRMFAVYGLTVVYLKRVMIGGLYLDESLKLGEYKELKADEVDKLCLKK